MISNNDYNLVLTFTLLALAMVIGTLGEAIDDNENDFLCYPEQQRNTRRACECYNDDAAPFGIRSVGIDCSYKELKTKDISEVLPLYVNTLDLSWNALDSLPAFASDSLRLLNVMHNNISRVSNKNFVKISNLRELYLNWNSIQVIEVNAFTDLAHLTILDLSHNNLHALTPQIFSPLLILEGLSLSWNRNLNETEKIQEMDFYQQLGVNSKLKRLRLQACSLANVVLPDKVPLVELDLRRNLLTQAPEKLPLSLETIDLSENLFEKLTPEDMGRISQVSELYLEDMPRLKSVEEDAFVPMQSLQKVSFLNSRRLVTFNGDAFGAENPKAPALKSMIFRGTTIGTLNHTLAPVFQQLTELDLNGMPLLCDCELVWIKQVKLETNGRCFNPGRLRGTLLSHVRISDFKCNTWPRWAYGLIILGLIVLCSLGIYVIVMGLRPHRGVTLRRRVGAGSPYARVTIEPNRQENN